MEKVIYILILIMLESSNFYKDVNTIYSPTTYDFVVNKNNKLTSDYVPSDLELIDNKYAYEDKNLSQKLQLDLGWGEQNKYCLKQSRYFHSRQATLLVSFPT